MHIYDMYARLVYSLYNKCRTLAVRGGAFDCLIIEYPVHVVYTVGRTLAVRGAFETYASQVRLAAACGAD